MRKFEKISYEQFKKDIIDNKILYKEYNIPKRGTKLSAGYDFYLLEDLEINPNEIKKITTGIKVSLEEDEFLMIIIRSSLGFKYNLRLTNQVGIIDSDYYNNKSNEGHIYVSIKNEGTEIINLKKGKAIIQGIINKYLLVEEDNIGQERIGGSGSTDKENINE